MECLQLGMGNGCGASCLQAGDGEKQILNDVPWNVRQGETGVSISETPAAFMGSAAAAAGTAVVESGGIESGRLNLTTVGRAADLRKAAACIPDGAPGRGKKSGGRKAGGWAGFFYIAAVGTVKPVSTTAALVAKGIAIGSHFHNSNLPFLFSSKGCLLLQMPARPGLSRRVLSSGYFSICPALPNGAL